MGKLERREDKPFGGVARQLHVAIGHEAEAVHEHLLESRAACAF